MLAETFVSTIIVASITGAGLMLAVYALITPISRKIFEKRVELLRKKKRAFDKMKTEIDPESSRKEFERLTNLASEIRGIKAFPKYLGVGVLIVFLGYLFTFALCFLWFGVSSTAKSTYEPTLLIFFFFSTIGFFLVGAFSIVDVHGAMKGEYEQLTKEQEKVEKDTESVLEKFIRMRDAETKNETKNQPQTCKKYTK